MTAGVVVAMRTLGAIGPTRIAVLTLVLGAEILGTVGHLLRSRTRGLRRLLVLSRTAWRWFGPGVTVRFLLLLWLSLTRRKALAVTYNRLGCVSFRRPFRGKKLQWARVDFGFIRDIFEQQSYTAFPEMEIGEADTVVDAGANVGAFTLFAAVHAAQGRVIALEPNGSLVRELVRNIGLNSLTNVEVVQAALSATDGTAVLWHAQTGSGNDSLIRGNSQEGEKVTTLSFPRLMELYQLDRVDFLKVDIEGAEWEIFSEAPWLGRVKRIALEVHGEHGDAQFLRSRLRSAGFRVFASPAALDGSLIYAVRESGGGFPDEPTGIG